MPPEPPVPPEAHGRRRLHLRYEDVSQDGHIVIEALPNALGAVWRQISQQRPATFSPGVVAILSRVVFESGEAPVSVTAAAEAEGFFHLAHTEGPDGSPERIILAMWAQVISPLGRTHAPQPPDAGRIIVAGRIFAEHVFTRPFGPPAERRVRSLVVDGGAPFVPEARYTWRDPEEAMALPEGADAIDAAPILDEATTVFGLDHTDSNQHVNSLVYPRLFIEAALRRFHALGLAGRLLARSMEIAYRKPCFAGERARVTVRAFRWEGHHGITAAISAEGDPPGARPRCAARLLFGGSHDGIPCRGP